MSCSQKNVSYSVILENGRVCKCHIDQLRDKNVEVSSTPVVTPDKIYIPPFPQTVSVEDFYQNLSSVSQEAVEDLSSVILETVESFK